MKYLKPMLSTAVLSLALSISVLAGEIQGPGKPGTCITCQEPTPSTESVETISTKDASTATVLTETDDVTLYILLAMLSFF